MTPQELESAGERLFGENWKGQIADALGIDYSTRWRMLKKNKVPGPVAASVSSWLKLHGARGILPPLSPSGPFRTSDGDILVLPAPHRNKSVPQIAEDIFGDQWKTTVSERLGISYSTFWRQMDAQEYSPQVVAALRAWHMLYHLLGVLPEPLDDTDKEIERPVKSKGSKYAKLLSD